MTKKLNSICFTIIVICVLILVLLFSFNDNSITTNKKNIETQTMEKNNIISTTPTLQEKKEVEYICYGDYLGYQQETTHTSENYKECLVNIKTAKKTGTGTILDCYNNYTIISTAAHVLWESENNNIEITFNDSTNIILSKDDYKIIYSNTKNDIAYIIFNCNIENFDSARAINFEKNIKNSLGDTFYFANYGNPDDKILDIKSIPKYSSNIYLNDINSDISTIYMEHNIDEIKIKGASGSGIFNKEAVCIGFLYMTENETLRIIPISNVIEDLLYIKNIIMKNEY